MIQPVRLPTRWVLVAVFTVMIAGAADGQQRSYTAHAIQLVNGMRFNLRTWQGYRISVAAEGLKRPRFFAQAPDGRVVVTDMYDRSDNRKGKVLILDSFNQTTRRFERITPLLQNLHNPNQVAFFQDVARQWWLYVAETGKLSRYRFTPGQTAPLTNGQAIASFPDYGLSYKYGGWHLTRSLAFKGQKLYVSVGSSCNACIEKEAIRASIIEMDPDGSNLRTYAAGIRNAVGLKWVGDSLWATNMGRDGIGPDKPQDQLLVIKPGVHYGWPYYVQYKQQMLPDETFKDSARPAALKPPPPGYTGLLAHSAPLGFCFVQQHPHRDIKGKFLVALHGSTSVWRQRGNSIVLVTGRDKYEPFVDGFLQGKTEDKRFGRPADVWQWNGRNFLISDDKNGVIYLLSYVESN